MRLQYQRGLTTEARRTRGKRIREGKGDIAACRRAPRASVVRLSLLYDTTNVSATIATTGRPLGENLPGSRLLAGSAGQAAVYAKMRGRPREGWRPGGLLAVRGDVTGNWWN